MKNSSNPFGFMSNPVLAAGLAAAWIVLLIAFQSLPQWDLAVSGWFFDAARCDATTVPRLPFCRGFMMGEGHLLAQLREILHPVPAVLAILLLVILVVEVNGGMRWRHPGVRMKSVLIATIVLGPGLIVNGILKAYWGRPRPWMTEDFGGWLPFVEAGPWTGECAGNCSFVSGEASAAGWLMCIALLLFARRRVLPGLVLAAVSVVMAALRVGFGAHYLSDVVLGFLLTVVLFSILAAAAENLAARRR